MESRRRGSGSIATGSGSATYCRYLSDLCKHRTVAGNGNLAPNVKNPEKVLPQISQSRYRYPTDHTPAGKNPKPPTPTITTAHAEENATIQETTMTTPADILIHADAARAAAEAAVRTTDALIEATNAYTAEIAALLTSLRAHTKATADAAAQATWALKTAAAATTPPPPPDLRPSPDPPPPPDLEL